MYGLLIVGVQQYIEQFYGHETWLRVQKRASLEASIFQTSNVYSETIMDRLLGALSDELGSTMDEVRYQNGLIFSEFTVSHGFGKLLRVQGRTFIDFLNNLDNLHEYLRLSYPKIRPPSFFVQSVSPGCIKLVYSSKRRGYTHYVRGQLVNLAKMFFDLDITVVHTGQYQCGLVNHTTYDIFHGTRGWFDSCSSPQTSSSDCVQLGSEINSVFFFDMFSFHLLVKPDMTVAKCGASFDFLDKSLEGSAFSDRFLIARPYINPDFDEV